MVNLLSKTKRNLRSILDIIKNLRRLLSAEKYFAKKMMKKDIGREARNIIEPWTKKRKWFFFVSGTVLIFASSQVISSDPERAILLFGLGTFLDIAGLWLTERRISYFERDVLSDSSFNKGNLEERVQKLEDRWEDRRHMF